MPAYGLRKDSGAVSRLKMHDFPSRKAFLPKPALPELFAKENLRATYLSPAGMRGGGQVLMGKMTTAEFYQRTRSSKAQELRRGYRAAGPLTFLLIRKAFPVIPAFIEEVGGDIARTLKGASDCGRPPR